jgi:hypothetical protein
MAPEEIIEHLGQLTGDCRGIERKDAVDDVVRTRPVGQVEVARLRRRPERTNDDARRVRPQIERLSVQRNAWTRVG